MPKAIAQHPLNNAHPIPEQRSMAHRQLIPTLTPFEPHGMFHRRGYSSGSLGQLSCVPLAQHVALERL